MREEAKRRAELYQALADGKTLQICEEKAHLKDIDVWIDIGYGEAIGRLCFISLDKLRIKPEPKKGWYRVALFKNGTATAETEYQEERFTKNFPSFIRWLTDRIEYELPEEEA